MESFYGNATGVTAKAGGDLGVYVGGNVVAGGAIGATGIYAFTLGGIADVTVEGDVFAHAGTGNASGVVAIGEDQADVLIHGNVTAYTTGGRALGVEAVSLGNVYVTVDGTVYAKEAAGSGAIGIAGVADGDVNVTVDGTIEVIGNLAYGVIAESAAGGNLTVDVGNVTVHQYGATHTNQGAGIQTFSTGVTNVTADNVYTTGNFTDGVHAGSKAVSNGDTYITLNSVETTGAYSRGVYVYGPGNATVSVGMAYTKGYRSDGVYAASSAGAA